MNIICSFDDKYSAYAGVMLTSLFENNKDSNITVYALTDYVNNDNKVKFNELAKSYSQHIEFIQIDIKEFKDFPHGGSKFSHIGLGTYYRLLSDSVLPINVDRALYLDCDIIVNDNLLSMYRMPFNGAAVIALLDKPDIANSAPSRLGYSMSYGYVNAGVLLINIDEWRNMHFSKKSFEYLHNNVDRIIYHDQDVLNAVLYDKKSVLPLRYNMMECFFMKQAIINECYKEQLIDAINNPAIIHFTGTRKPWHIECDHPYKYLYEKYLILSPWNGFPLQKRYIKRMDILKYKLKTIVKVLFDLMGIGKYTYVTLK